MMEYARMDRPALVAELRAQQAKYEELKLKGLKLDMSRGKPCPQQLDLSAEMMRLENYIGDEGEDTRNYGFLEGIPEARRFFADVMRLPSAENVLVCGNSALSIMYYLIDLGWRAGFVDTIRPWRFYTNIKFICPTPGYDRHFRVTEYFGFQLISVPMLETGPDMDMVERLVKEDEAVKGIWCVPIYSNPDGYCYSDETVRRLARMETAAPDFKIMWDDAYCVHTLTDEVYDLLPILEECEKAGHAERPLIFCSTSKMTFPGAGVAAVAGSLKNIKYILKNMGNMIISYDKMNQLRHVRFLKDRQGVLAHMAKHRAILQPKFELVKNTFARQLGDQPGLARWTDPQGGYFLSLYVMDGCAKRVVELCKQAGVVLTPAGAAYPYGIDPHDHHLRIAPTYPDFDELEQAARLLCTCVRVASLEKLIAMQELYRS